MFTSARNGLTPLGVGVLVLGLASAAAGHGWHNVALALTGYAAVVLVGVLLLSTARPLGITATRGELPRRVVAGAQVTGEVVLESSRTLTSVVVHERFPRELAGDVRLLFARLRKGKPTSRHYQFTAAHRGVYRVGPLTAEVSDPFGLVRRRQQLAEPVELIVHPTIEPVLDRIATREFTDPVLRPPRSLPWPTGAEFYGMRDYELGDDPRRIVWRASAAHDTVLVREAEYGVGHRVTLLLSTDAADYGVRPGADHPGFELGVSAAASVGNYHLRQGFSVSAEVDSRTLVKELRANSDRMALLDALAGVALEADAFDDAMDRLMLGRRADGHLVVITPVLTERNTSLLRVLQQRGASLVIVLPWSEATTSATLDCAASLRCPVVDLGATDLLTRPFEHAMGVRR